MGQGFYRQIVEALKAAGCEYRRQGKATTRFGIAQ